jgi:O-antigen/teichoic acid export membrane protein
LEVRSQEVFDHPVVASRRIIRNTFFLSVADVLNKAMMFVFYFIAARHLGVEKFGILSFAIAFVTMWSVFADLGLGIVAAREIARNREAGRRQVNAALAIKLVSTVLVVALIVCVINLLKFPANKVRVVYICTLFILEAAFTNFFVNVFQGLEKMHFTTLSRIIQVVVLVAGVIILRHSFPRTENYAWLYVGAGFASAAFAWGGVYFLIRPQLDFNFKRWWGVLRQALPLGLSVIFVTFYYWNGTTLLAKLSGDRAVGAYSAAFRIVWGSLFIPLSFSASVYPFFSRLSVSDPQRFVQTVARTLRYITVFALPIGGMGVVLARAIIMLIYGSAYEPAVLPLMILVWWSVFACFSSLFSYYFIAINRPVITTVQSAISLGVNLIANFILIPRFGAVGAALAIVTAELVGFLFLLWQHFLSPLRMKGGELALVFIRVGGALILVMATIRLVGLWNIWVGLGCGIILYITLLFICRIISRSDFGFILTLAKDRKNGG